MREARLGLFAALVALAAGSLVCSAGPERLSERVGPDELEARLGSSDLPLLLDVRTPEEYAAGFVPGARNVPVGELEARLLELEPEAESEIIVYCERGGRAERAVQILRDAGFSRVRLLDGSMSRWRSEGRPAAHPSS